MRRRDAIRGSPLPARGERERGSACIARRAFIAALGSAAAAVAFPRFARAQQTKAFKLGVLVVGNPQPFWTYFRDRLRELGYAEGSNAAFELRSAQGRPERLPELARELVGLKVDLIVAWQTPCVHAAKDATSEIPIVMLAGDPVGTGLIANLARPGGNITGISTAAAETAGKNVELIRDMIPGAQRVGVLANPADPFAKPFLEYIELAGQRTGIDILTHMIDAAEKFDAAFADMRRAKADAVIHQPSLGRQPAIDLALKYRLPMASPTRAFVEAGGLMSYSAHIVTAYGRVAIYVDKVLKGARPADLPVEQPTRFELVINLKTAKAIGLDVPPLVLARADEVIE